MDKSNVDSGIENITGAKRNIVTTSDTIDRENCTGYNYSRLDLFVPPIGIFNTLCISFDKTQMFLISFIRCVIIGLIVKIMYENLTNKGNIYYLFAGMVAYAVLNLIVLMIVMLKQQKYRKQFSNLEDISEAE